jgi:hypothetical protein
MKVLLVNGSPHKNGIPLPEREEPIFTNFIR